MEAAHSWVGSPWHSQPASIPLQVAHTLAKMLARSDERHQAGEPLEHHRALQDIMLGAGAVRMVHALLEKAPSERVLHAAD